MLAIMGVGAVLLLALLFLGCRMYVFPAGSEGGETAADTRMAIGSSGDSMQILFAGMVPEPGRRRDFYVPLQSHAKDM